MLSKGLDFLLKGGWIMWPLFACSIVSVTVMIERFISIRRAATDNEVLMNGVQQHLRGGDVDGAIGVCEKHEGPVPSLIASGLRSRHMTSKQIERAMEELALRETPVLYRRLGVLDTIITLAPLLGLLGTITGMIKAFNVVQSSTAASAPMAITGGVAEALIATATGLTVAIVTLPAYNYLSERVKEIIAEMEIRATQLLNILAVMQAEEMQASRLRRAQMTKPPVELYQTST